MKVRRKPEEYVARQFTSNMTLREIQELVIWCKGQFSVDSTTGFPAIELDKGGGMTVYPGDWIVKGSGGFGVCREEYFHETYERVSE